MRKLVSAILRSAERIKLFSTTVFGRATLVLWQAQKSLIAISYGKPEKRLLGLP